MLIPKSGLACYNGARPLVFCIETDTRACWSLVRGGLLGLVEVEEEVIAQQLGKGQAGTACGQVEQLGATYTHNPV